MTTRRASTLLAAFDELLGRRVSMRSMALLRVLVGPIVLVHLWPIAADAAHGRFYRDSFHEPYASWYPELPQRPYAVVMWIGVVAAVAMTIGLLTRWSTFVTWLVVTWNLFLSTINFHNNRAYLVIVLAALALTPCGRELSLDAAWRARRGRPPLPLTAPAWPLWLLRFEAATVYAASGFSKLIDPDWFGGVVTWQRSVLRRPQLEASPLPSWAIELLMNRGFDSIAAKTVIATELFIAVGLWSRRTRPAAIWLAICFHVSIQLSAEVETFSALAISVLVIWAVPSTRDRVLTFDADVVAQRRFAAAVARLDWLGRFRGEERASQPAVVVDRDGRMLRGRDRRWFVLSRLPLVAWFALPVWGARSLLSRAPLHVVSDTT